MGSVDIVWYAVLLGCGVAYAVVSRRAPVGRPAGSPAVSAAAVASAKREPARPVLSTVLDPRANGLNTVRLVLAAAVLLWHSYPLTGRELRAGVLTQPLAHLLADGPVDGFFAVSGFLIAGSWARRPDLVAFLRSRALRIVPAYLVCLVVTAGVIAPLGLVLGDQRVGLAPYLRSAVGYVVSSAGLALTRYDIAGTPSSVPYPGAWNGSIWTLQWEVGCYLGVLGLGLLGLLRRPSTSVVVFLVGTGLSVLVLVGALPGGASTQLARLTTMFAAGMLLHAWRDRVPVTPRLVALAGAGTLACLWLPDYRVPGALLLAYTTVALAAYLRAPRWHLRDDLSYGVYIYAFPVQQLLALTALVRAPLPVFVLAALGLTLPMAAASWWLVERPVLRRRHRPVEVTGQPSADGSDPKPQASMRQSR